MSEIVNKWCKSNKTIQYDIQQKYYQDFCMAQALSSFIDELIEEQSPVHDDIYRVLRYERYSMSK